MVGRPAADVAAPAMLSADGGGSRCWSEEGEEHPLAAAVGWCPIEPQWPPAGRLPPRDAAAQHKPPPPRTTY